NIIFILFLLITINIYIFAIEPEYPFGGQVNVKDRSRGKEKSARFKSSIETGKKHYYIGEAIHYKITINSMNNLNGYFRGGVVFELNSMGLKYIGTKFVYEYRLHHEFKSLFIIPIYRFAWHGEYYGPSADSGNVYTYFQDYSDLQYTIKPGQYYLIVKFIDNSDIISSQIGYDTIEIHIDSVPDIEKDAFILLKNGNYEELLNKYPKSVYFPTAEFYQLCNDVKKYKLIYAKNIPETEISKLRTNIQYYYIDLIKNYPDFTAGEIVTFLTLNRKFFPYIFFIENYSNEKDEFISKLNNIKNNKLAKMLYKDFNMFINRDKI
ncbi:hypothetical protein KAU43_04025, partial [candidate division WOR-3 bacterium]|nr:hypothetical protein [candidate division WOR-3 bacterium]